MLLSFVALLLCCSNSPAFIALTNEPTPVPFLAVPVDTGAGLQFVPNESAVYSPLGAPWEFDVYAFRDNADGQRSYSAPLIYRGIDPFPSENNFYITAAWQPVQNATGYRVVMRQCPWMRGGPLAIETTHTSILIGRTYWNLDNVSWQRFHL